MTKRKRFYASDNRSNAPNLPAATRGVGAEHMAMSAQTRLNKVLCHTGQISIVHGSIFPNRLQLTIEPISTYLDGSSTLRPHNRVLVLLFSRYSPLTGAMLFRSL